MIWGRDGTYKSHHFPSVQGLVGDMFEWITSIWQVMFFSIFWDFSSSLMLLLNSCNMSGNTFTIWTFQKLFLLSVLTQMGWEFVSVVINLDLPKILRFPVCFSLLETASLSSTLSMAFCNFLISFFCIFCLTVYFHGYIKPSRRLCTNVLCFLGDAFC